MKTAIWATTFAVMSIMLTTAVLPAAATTADAKFTALRDKYFLQTLQRNPVTSTYLGGDGYSKKLKEINGKLRNYRADALAAESDFYRTLQADLQKIDADALSPSTHVDYEAMTAQLAFLVRQYEVVRNHQRAVETYVIEPVNGVNYQLQQMQTFADGLLGSE